MLIIFSNEMSLSVKFVGKNLHADVYGMHHTGFTSQPVYPMYVINTKTNTLNSNSTRREDLHRKPAKVLSKYGNLLTVMQSEF